MAVSNDIVISTTGELDGWEITEYLDTVSAHVVTGTNVFSDVFASFSDIFGGRSKSYQNQLTSIDEEVVDALREEAADLGADAVIGIRIDHDEVSGSGKSMFMVTASGTAVRANRLRDETQTEKDGQRERLSKPEMERWIKRESLLEKAEAGELDWLEDTWEFFTQDRTEEAAPAVLRRLRDRCESNKRPRCGDTIDRASRYFESLPRHLAASHLYDAFEDLDGQPNFRRALLKIIEEANAMNYERSIELVKHEDLRAQMAGLETLALVKPRHRPEDIDAIETAIELIEEGFPVIVEEKVNEGMFSDKEVWVCMCGAENEKDFDRCEACGKDKRGFKRSDTAPEEVLSKLRWRRRALEDVFT